MKDNQAKYPQLRFAGFADACEIWKKTLHVAFPKKINKNEIGKLSIMTTNNIDEQKHIGNLFKDINRNINLTSDKVNNLKQIKKFLMQNMFI